MVVYKLIYFTIFCTLFGVLSLFYKEKGGLEKNANVSDRIMFPIKFSPESLQIFYMDSLYHTHQYVCDYKFVCSFFCAFGCFLHYLY